jgi:hypothetical protein
LMLPCDCVPPISGAAQDVPARSVEACRAGV